MDIETARTRRRARLLWLVGCVSLLLAIAVLGTISWRVYLNWTDAQIEVDITQSNRLYLRTLNNILAEVDDAETGERGFLLTGRDHYLEPYKRALQPLNHNLQALLDVSRSDPRDDETVNRLESLVHSRMAGMAETIQLRRNKGIDAALAEVLTDKGMLEMEEIRKIYRAAADAQRADVALHSSVAAQHELAAIKLSAIGGVMLLGLMVAGFIALNSGAKQQTQFAERLASSREIFETTLTSIGDGVIATDPSGQITFMNPEAVRLTGWPRQEAVGKTLKQVFRILEDGSGRDTESFYDMVIRTGSATGFSNPTVLVRQDGSEIPIDDSGAPIRNAYGEVSGVVLIFRDVTERRKSEESLALSHSEVLKANEELRQFSYAATHDLQEPLRTIVVFSQLLGRGYRQFLDEHGLHLLKTVEEAAHRMSTLIDHLLAYTRADGLDSSGTLAAVSAEEIFADTLVQLKGAIEETKAVITRGELPVVWSDPAQLSHVFQNLIGNAIKYRKPDAAPAIHIKASVDGEQAVFQIQDNGMGFKQEYAERIFLLFQRLHGRSIPGTGIGLALCRRIIERQGGKIWAVSEENIGSSFYFTLPLARETDETATAG